MTSTSACFVLVIRLSSLPLPQTYQNLGSQLSAQVIFPQELDHIETVGQWVLLSGLLQRLLWPLIPTQPLSPTISGTDQTTAPAKKAPEKW